MANLFSLTRGPNGPDIAHLGNLPQFGQNPLSQGLSLLSEIGRRFTQIFWFKGDVKSWVSILYICPIHLNFSLS